MGIRSVYLALIDAGIQQHRTPSQRFVLKKASTFPMERRISAPEAETIEVVKVRKRANTL